MKKLISVLLTFISLFITAIGANAEDNTAVSNPLPENGSGMCGENMYWSLSDNGTLKIFGSGEMYDYYDKENDILNMPWQKNNNSADVTEIIIEDGVQSICDFAFAKTSVSEIKLPDSVKYVGQYAFSHCGFLSDVVLSDNLEAIPEGAFMYDGMLESIYLPQGLKSIGTYAFNYCKNLKNVIIPKNVTEIGLFAFANNELIEEVVIPQKTTSIAENAFYNCSGLKKIIFSEGLERDAYYAKNNILSQLPDRDGIMEVISVNGQLNIRMGSKIINFPDAKPFVDENSRTQIPIRAVAEALGCTVEWNGKSAVLTSPDDIKITLTPGSSIMKVNDAVTEMDSAAVISENRTYIPARFAAEAMNYTVKYKNLK